jgi:N-acetylmuramoyl-L-alanine amidase
MMVGWFLAAVAMLPAAPLSIVVRSARGETRLPVRLDPEGGPVVSGPLLLRALDALGTRGEGWAEVAIGPIRFRFFPGAALYSVDGKVRPLAGIASVRHDTLLIPLQFVSEILPRAMSQRFHYDARQARLVDNSPALTVAKAPPPDPNRLPNGLRKGHVVTIDPGHGGIDPGNPGLFFPRGIKEKHVTLQLALLLRDELEGRGVGVVMTRTRDTIIDRYQRASFCTDECDLFVSIHINSLDRRAGYNRIRGFETYFLGEAKTEDAARVAQMENESIRFENEGAGTPRPSEFEFLMKDLQLNEHLRESARAAELIQSYLQEAHTGPDLGVKQANLIVLNTASRPAILVEVGFSTNPEDAKLMAGRAGQKNLANSMADAVVAYLLEYERKVGPATRSTDAAHRPRQR